MSDLIDREEAIKAVYDKDIGMLTQWDIGRNAGIDYAIKQLEKLPSAQPEQRWIPCSETVDIPDHEVMACDRCGEFIIGYLDCKDEQWLCESDDSLMYDPVAWCELPKPYKEGGVDG